tara:strand:+ start:354 stop:1034 length:681 start_codon:yes stop_codon:yes gene_type:complete
VSVAVGKQYELEVQRLLEAYPNTIVITQRTPGIETAFSLQLLNGLATKCLFGCLLPDDSQGPVVLCDADLHPLIEDPLKQFSVKDETDVAYVIYQGKWHFPKRLEAYEKAIAKVGKINSGFVYFKNIQICKEICKEWHAEYMKRMDHHKIHPDLHMVVDYPSSTGEYDEPSLIYVLDKKNYNIEYLDPRWNVWDGSPTPKAEAYFYQEHLNDWNMYKLNPSFRNEG